MSSRRAKARAEKVAAIVLVAGEEFAECGFTGCTMGNVAARANIRKSVLFHYFVDKQALYETAVVMPIDALARVLDDIAALEPSFLKRLALFSVRLQEHFDIDTSRARLLLRGMLDGPPPGVLRPCGADRVLSSLVDCIERGVVEARVPVETEALGAGLSALASACTDASWQALPLWGPRKQPRPTTFAQRTTALEARMRRHLEVAP